MDKFKEFLRLKNIILDEALIEELLSISNKKEFQRGELILRKEMMCRHLYFVNKGLIRQFYYKNGEDITTSFAIDNSTEFSTRILFHNTTAYYIEAIEPSVIRVFNFEKLKILMSQNHKIAELYIYLLQSNIEMLQKNSISCGATSAHSRYDKFVDEYPELVRRAPVAHIATYLGMSPETLSRVRAGKL